MTEKPKDISILLLDRQILLVDEKGSIPEQHPLFNLDWVKNCFKPGEYNLHVFENNQREEFLKHVEKTHTKNSDAYRSLIAMYQERTAKASTLSQSRH